MLENLIVFFLVSILFFQFLLFFDFSHSFFLFNLFLLHFFKIFLLFVSFALLFILFFFGGKCTYRFVNIVIIIDQIISNLNFVKITAKLLFYRLDQNRVGLIFLLFLFVGFFARFDCLFHFFVLEVIFVTKIGLFCLFVCLHALLLVIFFIVVLVTIV